MKETARALQHSTTIQAKSYTQPGEINNTFVMYWDEHSDGADAASSHGEHSNNDGEPESKSNDSDGGCSDDGGSDDEAALSDDKSAPESVDEDAQGSSSNANSTRQFCFGLTNPYAKRQRPQMSVYRD